MKKLQALLQAYDQAKAGPEGAGAEVRARLGKIQDEIKALGAQIATEARASASAGTTYIPYPRYDDAQFFEKINRKKEFAKTMAPPFLKPGAAADFESLVKDKCGDAGGFKLAPHQIFAKNFISPNTPYNGLLLFHGVGVGKSCTAITIAEQFAGDKVFKKPCLVLAPKNLKENFLQQVYTRSKGVYQCTGNTYHRIATEDPFYEKIDRRIRQAVEEKYQCMGFQEFANRMLDLEAGSKDRARYVAKIKNEFSDRVIIIDEVHNIRNEDGGSKIVPPTILEMLQYTERVKLILLTATPMFNEASEIIWLANLLLANDKRALLTQSEVFGKGAGAGAGGLTKRGAAILAQAFRGYVSFMRSENPFSFPMRLFPRLAVRAAAPSLDMMGRAIPAGERLSAERLPLDTSFMSDYQREIYEALEGKERKIREEGGGEGDGEEEEEEEGGRGGGPGRGQGQDEMTNPVLFQAANIVFPGTQKIGKAGFFDCFTLTRNKKLEYKNKKHADFLAPEKIGNYAPKIKTIVDRILNATGVVFVYSYYYEGGLVPLALALEHAGFSRYGGGNFLAGAGAGAGAGKKHLVNGKLATYTILGKQYTNNFQAEVEAARAPSNVYGEDIKVILGTSVAAEGIDFKFIREVHVLEPWYHLNKLEQIVGRAVRNCSHIALPPGERNVTVSFHVNRIMGRARETVDERHYRLAWNKKAAIEQVERILKENSVDCVLNKNVLVFDPGKIGLKIDVTTSQGEVIKNVPVGDVPGKYEAISCAAGQGQGQGPLDTTTFQRSFYSDDISAAVPVVSAVFLDKGVKALTYDQIRARIGGDDVMSDDVLMFTLDYLLTQKIVIGSGSGFRLLYRSNLYMLQPLAIGDTRIPVADRGVGFTPVKQINIDFKSSAAAAAAASAPKAADSVWDPIKALVDKVHEIKADLGIGAGEGAGLEQAFYDFCVDRLSAAEMRALASALMSRPHKPALAAMVSGTWIVPELGWVRDTVDHLVWYHNATGTRVTPRELAGVTDEVLGMGQGQVRRLQDLTGYMVMNQKKMVPQFKLMDKNKSLSLGFVCDQTTTFSIADARQAIEAMDKKKVFSADLKKVQLCKAYEVLLRKEGARFARPVEAAVAVERARTRVQK